MISTIKMPTIVAKEISTEEELLTLASTAQIYVYYPVIITSDVMKNYGMSAKGTGFLMKLDSINIDFWVKVGLSEVAIIRVSNGSINTVRHITLSEIT